VASRIFYVNNNQRFFDKNDVINHVSTLVFLDENQSLFAPVDLYTTTSIAAIQISVEPQKVAALNKNFDIS